MFLSTLSQGGLLWGLSRHLLHTKLQKISATESASILHCHPHKSKALVWRERNQQPPKPWTLISPQPVPEAIAHGNLFSSLSSFTLSYKSSRYERDAVVAGLSLLVQSLQTSQKDTVSTICEIRWCTPGILVGADGLTCCSPDALWKDENGDWHGLEVKCPFNPENIPTPQTALVQDPHYLLQAFHCLHCSDALDWHLFYYDPRNLANRRLIKLYRNESLWESILFHYKSFLKTTQEPGRKSKYDRLVGETLLSRIKTELVE